MSDKERELRETVESMLLAQLARRAWELATWPDADRPAVAATT